MGASREIKGSAADKLTEVFTEYLKFNERETSTLVKDGARKLAEELFLSTPRASASDIHAKLQSLGWNFKRAPWGYVRKVGPTAENKSGKSRSIKARRVKNLTESANLRRQAKRLIRPNKKNRDAGGAAKLFAQADAIDAKFGKHYTEEEQKAAAYNFRKGHIGSQAASWIPAMRKLGSRLRVANDQRGGKMRPAVNVSYQGAGSKYSVIITNHFPGAAKLAERTGYTDKAMYRRAADMEIYIARKKEELAAILERL